MELAQKYKTHIDTVIAYRRRHLEQTNREEMLASFQRYADQEIDWDKIKQAKEEDKKKEAEQEGRKKNRKSQQKGSYEYDEEEDQKVLED